MSATGNQRWRLRKAVFRRPDEQIRAADGAGLAGQDEEGGLESIFRVGFVAQHAPADVQDHWAVPPEERSKRRLVPPVAELLEQLLVGQLLHALVFDDLADQLQDRAGHGLGHHALPVGRKRLCLFTI